jgi:hypothetical protein
MRALLRANASMLFSLARRAVRGAALSMASIPAAQGQEPVSLDLPGERARGLDGGVEHAREILPPERRFVCPHRDGMKSTAGEHKSFWLVWPTRRNLYTTFNCNRC